MSPDKPARAVFELRLVGKPGTAGIHNLRALLKRLLRQHGFVCVDARREGVGALGIEARGEMRCVKVFSHRRPPHQKRVLLFPTKR